MARDNSAPSRSLLGTSLVIGGCGFLGYHLVRHLLEDPESGVVYVFDRVVDRNRHDGAEYICGDITDSENLRSLLEEIKPNVIFHAASPIAALPANREHEFFDTNVKGTEILLTLATELDFVCALVFTATVDAYANPPHTDVNESYPLWSESDKFNEYSRTKAIADRLVREANGPRLRTACLRLGHAYGERHVQGMVEVLDMCADGKWLFQLGKGDNVMEVVSADNNATAHILAAKALLDPSRAAGKVDGEAFNISDGAPVLFWHHIRVIWRTVRGEAALKEVIILPAWSLIVAVYLAEWLYWILTLNTAKPPIELGRTGMHYAIHSHTYPINKAQERLRFRPVVNHDAILEQSTRWMIEHRKGVT